MRGELGHVLPGRAAPDTPRDEVLPRARAVEDTFVPSVEAENDDRARCA